jgi:cleavage stimulation factor subunit 2
MAFAHFKVVLILIDHETAASAVRNLNNYDVGGRQLRIDFAEDKDAPEDPKARKTEAPGSNSAEIITPIIQQMDPQQLAEVLSYLKVISFH